MFLEVLKTPDYLDFSELTRTEIANLLAQHHLRLTIDEALTIQQSFLRRPPTLAECILWSIQGSEHCSYKSSRRYLQKFNTKGSHVILGPKEDAGIIAIATDNQGLRYGLVVSHESHNHPSQLVPYEGAATGVGGNVRDVCCMGAEVFAVADSLRFGEFLRSRTQWIEEGVVAGIAGYANPLGIANITGDLFYDPGYNDNCLVTVVTLGIVREDQMIHSFAPAHAQDYVFILVGKPTDNSGFGGAAFASCELSDEKNDENKGAVQEPNAFLQRHLLKANYAFFDYLKENNLTDQVGFKDLGAGGIACASIELASGGGYGAHIELEKVPTSIANLSPEVILCSETQERFMWVVPRALANILLEHYNHRFALPQICTGAKATIIGYLRQDEQYIVNYHGQIIVHAKAKDITDGIQYNRPFCKKNPTLTHFAPNLNDNLTASLKKLISHENIASRAPIYEQYDKQVQGRTVIERGTADAGVFAPFNEEKYPEEIQSTGVALSIAQNPRYCQMDAYWGAVNAVCEAARKVVAVGAWPSALTDCLCFGNPEIPEHMNDFVEAIQGIIDAAKAISTSADRTKTQESLPIISGNVSLYNESKSAAIPPSPIISCIGIVRDAQTCVQSFFQQANSIIILVGERKKECGGSIYYQLYEQFGDQLPRPNLQQLNNELQAVYNVIQKGHVLSAHSISLGGLAVAIVQMCIVNKLGAYINITHSLREDEFLFSETGGFILETSPNELSQLKNIFNELNVPFFIIGETSAQNMIQMNHAISITVDEASALWADGLYRRH